MVSPDAVASFSMKAAKSMTVTEGSCPERESLPATPGARWPSPYKKACGAATIDSQRHGRHPLIDAPSAVSTMSPTNELSDLSKPVNG